jgi:hypothetical protein
MVVQNHCVASLMRSQNSILSEIADFGGKAIFADALRMTNCLRSLRRVFAVPNPEKSRPERLSKRKTRLYERIIFHR